MAALYINNSIFQSPKSFQFQKIANIHELITQALINLNVLHKTVGVAEMDPSLPFDVLANGLIWK